MYSNTNSKTKELTIKYTNVEMERLTFSELKEGKGSKGQKNAYPKYNHPSAGSNSPLFIQFPWLTLSTYGIPKIGEYIRTDADRLYIKCPLDISETLDKDLYDNLIVKLDNYLSSPEIREQLFGKKANNYDYNELYKIPKPTDEDSKSKYPKPPFIKLKLDVSYPDNNIKTIVYKTLSDGSREKINDIETISDLEKIICWKCKIRPIVRLTKVWAQTVGSGKSAPGYGATFTVIKVEVEAPSETNMYSLITQYQEDDTFIDDDNTTVINNNTKPKTKIATIVSDSDDSDDSENFEEDNLDTIIPNHTDAKNVQQIIQDDESEEEIKPVKGVKAKNKPLVVKDEESDEEVKPVKTKTKSKPVVESESEEEIKPAKNVKKNKKLFKK